MRFDKFFSDKNQVLFLWVIAFIINSITFLLIHYKIHPSNKPVALHYYVLTGVDLYGKGKSLYSIPFVGFLLTIANLILFSALKNRQNFLAFLCSFISIVVQVILVLATLFIIRINP